ncbi:hypothetical protein ACQP3F_32145, partial [Escherichia coli]
MRRAQNYPVSQSKDTAQILIFYSNIFVVRESTGADGVLIILVLISTGVQGVLLSGLKTKGEIKNDKEYFGNWLG